MAEPVKMEMETTVTTTDGAGAIFFLRLDFDTRVYYIFVNSMGLFVESSQDYSAGQLVRRDSEIRTDFVVNSITGF